MIIFKKLHGAFLVVLNFKHSTHFVCNCDHNFGVICDLIEGDLSFLHLNILNNFDRFLRFFFLHKVFIKLFGVI